MGKATEEVSNRKTMGKGLEFVQKLEALIRWWKRTKFMGKATEEVSNGNGQRVRICSKTKGQLILKANSTLFI